MQQEQKSVTDGKKIEGLNPWISLLKVFMCFVVIQDHFPTNQETIAQKGMAFFGDMAVPCFMFLSFYLMGKDFLTLKRERVSRRLLRLYLPVLFWSLVYFTVKNSIAFIFGNYTQTIGFKGLLMNLLFSHYKSLTPHLWFMIAQIIDLVVIVTLLNFTDNRKKQIIILTTLMLVVFILEYSGVAFYLFDSAPYETRYPLGRTIECIPYAVCGILFSWCFKSQNQKRKVVILGGLAILTVISYFVPEIPDYMYGGLYLLFASVTICCCIITIPDSLYGKMRTAVNWVGSCTMGIYCLHRLVGAIMNTLLPNLLFQGSLVFDFIIFTVCLLSTSLVHVIALKKDWKRLLIVW